MRVSITLAALGALTAAINIILIFLSATFAITVDPLVISLFILGMSAVVVSLFIYILEINQSLKAIELELKVWGPWEPEFPQGRAQGIPCQIRILGPFRPYSAHVHPQHGRAFPAFWYYFYWSDNPWSPAFSPMRRGT